VGLVTEAFRGFARELLDQRNAGSLPLAVVQHPIGGIPPDEAAARITDEVIDAVIVALQKERDS
jgi:hypothetical protein